MKLKVTTAARVEVGDKLLVSVDPFELVHVAVIGGLPEQGNVYFHTRQRQSYRRRPSDRVVVYRRETQASAESVPQEPEAECVRAFVERLARGVGTACAPHEIERMATGALAASVPAEGGCACRKVGDVVELCDAAHPEAAQEPEGERPRGVDLMADLQDSLDAARTKRKAPAESPTPTNEEPTNG